MRPLDRAPSTLDGAVAIVTGGAGGIGRASARALIDSGVTTYSVDLADRDHEPDATALECDVADPAAVETLFDRVEQRHDGRLDIVVHCAGITRDAVLWKMTPQAWSDVLRVNLDSAFHLLHRAAPTMRARAAGSVVLISSINGERGKFGQANYTASKAGLLGLTRTAARELGRFGIRVNAVAPGMIESSMTSELADEIRQAAIDESALGCIGRPQDVANAVLFLASPMSAHMTGQVLRVDGGQLMA